jgi:hypothetical protein
MMTGGEFASGQIAAGPWTAGPQLGTRDIPGAINGGRVRGRKKDVRCSLIEEVARVQDAVRSGRRDAPRLFEWTRSLSLLGWTGGSLMGQFEHLLSGQCENVMGRTMEKEEK